MLTPKSLANLSNEETQCAKALPPVRAAATARYWPLKYGKYSMVEVRVDLMSGSKPDGVLVTSLCRCADIQNWKTGTSGRNW